MQFVEFRVGFRDFSGLAFRFSVFKVLGSELSFQGVEPVQGLGSRV